MNFIWEAVIIILVGFMLLRLLGKKTISQMTGLEVYTLLCIASITGHAVSEQDLWKTIIVLCIFACSLICVQFLAIKFNFVEKFLIGKATLVIEEGKFLTKNLKKLRMTVDQLETRLREKGISSFDEVKMATIEMSGELGYQLESDAKPLTIKEFKAIMEKIGITNVEITSDAPLFDEIKKHSHK